MAFAIDKIRGAVATGANGSPRQIAKLHSLAVADAEVPTVIQLSRLNIARAVLVELHDGHVELTKRVRERAREREERERYREIWCPLRIACTQQQSLSIHRTYIKKYILAPKRLHLHTHVHKIRP
jgi:hypothetical protein